MKPLFDMPPENKGKPYREEELELIFSLPPTIRNIKLLAKVLKRSEHGIEQQYQWAMLRDKTVEEKWWPKDMPCRKVAKKMWWIQTY